MHRQGTDFQIQLQGYGLDRLIEIQDQLAALEQTDAVKAKLTDIEAEFVRRRNAVRREPVAAE